MKKIIFLMVLVLITLESCSTDMLEFSATDSLDKTSIANSPELLTNFVSALYNAPRDGFSDARFLDALSDNAYQIHNSTGTWEYVQGNVDADNGEGITKNIWNRSYSYIREINVFFETLEESTIDAELKTQLTAEVKFIRAYTYANLIKWYGGVPIVKQVFGLNDSFEIPRNSYDEVVTYIIEELDEAIPNLPTRTTDGRVNAVAAMALKSRVLLYAASLLNNPSNDQTKWIAARDATKDVIDIVGDNALHPDYQEVFIQSTTETLWERQFTQARNNKVYFQNTPNGYPGGGGSIPIQSLIDAYNMDNGQPITDAGSGYNPQDPYTGRDPRFYASILYNGAMFRGRAVETFVGGLDTDAGIQPWNTSDSGYYLRKWIDEDAPSDWFNEAGKGETTWIFFRIGEVYLNYAETFLALDDEVNAKIWMNKTRTRVGMPSITTETDSDLIARYRNERRVELAYEDHRFFDILRWKIAKEVIDGKPAMGVTITNDGLGNFTYDYTRQFQDRFFTEKQYRLPVPRTDINKTNNALEQNPLYD